VNNVEERTMKYFLLACFAAWSAAAFAADVPEASAEFRAQYIKENTSACVKGIEDQADLKALYSSKTVEAYCTCRQRYRADVIAQAKKDGRRGVFDEAAAYAEKKCNHILIEQLEHE